MNISVLRRTEAIRHLTALPAGLLSLAILLGLAITTPGLATVTNLLNIFNQQVSLIAVTLGQTLVVLTGGLDLSVGSVVSLTTAICSLDLPTGVAVALSLFAAILVGCINAVGITRMKIHPILMTLSTMTATQGVALLIRPVPGGTSPVDLVNYANTSIFGIPLAVYFITLLTCAVFALTHLTRFGLHVFAVGGMIENAELGGVRTLRTVALVYIASALLACLGGVNLAARIGGGDPLVGLGFSTDSIAAVALGGVLLSGGMGSILGPIAGLAVLALLGTGLNYWNVSTYYQMVVKGLLLVAAVSVHRRNVIGL